MSHAAETRRMAKINTVPVTNPVIRINDDSRVPKYRQIINSIVEDIESGILEVGKRVPSINEISEGYFISRDTVEKAFNHLKKEQIIVSERGKGFYVARNLTRSKVQVLFLLNKLSSYKLQIFNSFVVAMGAKAHVDLVVYHCEPSIFLNAIKEALPRYDYFVVMPHFRDGNGYHQNVTPEVIDALKTVPAEKLFLVDNFVDIPGTTAAGVFQDFTADLYDSLTEAGELLKKYQKLILVFPGKAVYPFPVEIRLGFERFCIDNEMDNETIGQIYPDMELQKKDAYICVEENDLVTLMKQVRDKGLRPGSDIGIISYNDTPLKELLDITVISTDFKLMGETTAYMISKHRREAVRNIFRLINRGSL